MPRRLGVRSALLALGRRHPRTAGTFEVSGLQAPITIGRDRWGVPHIDAANDADAWFGLGFCHGQDRGFQLEVLLRAGRGSLAELFGPAILPVDRLVRTLGFRRLGEAQRRVLDADVEATLTAYVAGVNAAAAASPRPHELVLLRAHRTPWQVEDVLAFLGLQSLALAGNWDSELARLAVLLADGPDALAAVDQPYAAWLPATLPPGSVAGPALERLAADLASLRSLIGGDGASNAWAVAASRTTTGAPILANDPHLAPAVPGPWYLAHLHAPDWAVAGASFVGGPAFPSAHNGHAAWGITAGCSDSSDLFWEEFVGPDTVRGPAGPEPLTVIEETIEVRGRPSETLLVRVTPRGPIVTPALDGVGTALSLRATWLEPAPVRGLLDVVRARDFASFRTSFAAWPGPALNVAYADAGGHIGYQLLGTLPRRRSGNGTLPAPAWEGGWEDEHLSFDDLPWTLDPDAGFVATANNAPRADAADLPFLGVDWLDGYRAARITERLASSDAWDVRATSALQVDVASVPWREMRDLVLATDVGPDARLALALLRGWDGRVSADSPAASVFEVFVADLAAAIAREAAPIAWRWAMGEGFGDGVPRTTFGARTLSHLVRTLRDGTDRSAQVAASLARAQEVLVRRHSPNPARWAWGQVRPLVLPHVLGAVRPLDRLFNLGPVACGGDTNTVAQAGVLPLDPTANAAAIANHRMVVDLADVERSRFVLAGGQSGNPLSPHYDDLLPLWLRGEGIGIAWSPEAVERATVDRLLLQPVHETAAATAPS